MAEAIEISEFGQHSKILNLCTIWAKRLNDPAKPICDSSLDLLHKRFAFPLFNDAKNRTLVSIA
jgi:hypothetical protein